MKHPLRLLPLIAFFAALLILWRILVAINARDHWFDPQTDSFEAAVFQSGDGPRNAKLLPYVPSGAHNVRWKSDRSLFAVWERLRCEAPEPDVLNLAESIGATFVPDDALTNGIPDEVSSGYVLFPDDAPAPDRFLFHDDHESSDGFLYLLYDRDRHVLYGRYRYD